MPKSFSFIKKNCSNKIPSPSTLNNSDTKLINNLKNDLPNLIKLIDNQELNEFIKKVVNYCFEANKYFNDLEPWSLKTKDKQRMETIVFTICEQIKNISILLNPIIPVSTTKVLKAMNFKDKDIIINNINNLKCFNKDIELKDLEILFKKIENDN